MDHRKKVLSSVGGKNTDTRQNASKTDKDKHEDKTKTNKHTKKRKGQIRRHIQRQIQSQGSEREEHLQVEAIFAWQGKKLAHGRDSTTSEQGKRGFGILESRPYQYTRRNGSQRHEGRYEV
jgi:hypothetical protein